MTTDRQLLRQQLRASHAAWAGSPQAAPAASALTAHVVDLLATLEPACLGLYWPLPGEFDPRPAALRYAADQQIALALPWATPEECLMTFRAWRGEAPTTKDGCGIVSPDTEMVAPDVLLVPCVGFTRSGIRLGYGGGYYDRYLASHPHVTSIGLAWSHALVDDTTLAAAPHDQPMMLVVTPQGIVNSQ